MFNHTKFEVSLTIGRVTRIPFSLGSISVKWRVTDSARPDAHGRTEPVSVQRNEAHIDFSTTFTQRIRLRTPSKLLRNCPCRFEVVWEPLGGKDVTIGTLNLDIEQFARLPNQTDEDIHFSGKRLVAGQQLPFLLKGARTNCLIALRIDLRYVSGNDEYEVPDFTTPTVGYSKEEEEGKVADPVKGGRSARGNQDRDKLRKLRDEVLFDLRDDPTVSMNGDWHNIDFLLKGENKRIGDGVPDEYADNGPRDPRTMWDISIHKAGKPFLETEIRENFVTWNIFGSSHSN